MSDDSALRARVVAEARSWVGTPYHHMADVKGVGVDCGMILVRIFVDLGLVPPFDPRPYTNDWMMHRSEEHYLGALMDRARPVKTPAPGDVALWRQGRCYSHGGVVVALDPLTIVHAVLNFGCVVEEVAENSTFLMDRMRTVKFASIIGAGA